MEKVKDLYIIIAEDDLDDIELVELSFEKHAAFGKIKLVHNGQELVNFLKETERLPDVILTDINMPFLNGIEALKEILRNPRLSNIPAYVYSSTINPAYEAKCKELGIKGYLIKPISIQEFYLIPEKVIAHLDD